MVVIYSQRWVVRDYNASLLRKAVDNALNGITNLVGAVIWL